MFNRHNTMTFNIKPSAIFAVVLLCVLQQSVVSPASAADDTLLTDVVTPVSAADDSLLTDDELYDDEYCPDMFGKASEEQDKAESEFLNFLDPQQQTVSEYLRSFTTKMDRFFAASKTLDDHTDSYMNLILDTTFYEGGVTEVKPRLKFRLRLPQTQKKLKLLIESDPDEKRDTRDLETRSLDTTRTQDQNSGVYAGVEKDIPNDSKWKVRPSLGIRLRSPLDWYTRFYISRDEYFDVWKVYLKETVYWFDSTGFGSDTTMDWDRYLTPDLIFRSGSFLRYTHERKQFDMSQSLNLIHQLSQNRSVIYKAAVFADSEPAIYATGYLLNINYRQNLHKNFLFLELQPSILYEKTTGWEPEHQFFIRLEAFYRG